MSLLPLKFYIISSFVNFATSFILGFVLLKNFRAKPNRLFSIFSFTVAGWSWFYSIWLLTENKYIAEFYLRTCMIFVFFMPSLFIHFVTIFTNRPKKIGFYVVNYIISIIFAFTVYTPFYANNPTKHLLFPYWLHPGPIFHLTIIHFSVIIIYSFCLLFIQLKKAKGTLRNQLLYVFIGTAVGYTGGATNYFCWYRIPIPPIPNALVAFYVAVVTYAIARYRLMDINIAIKKFLTYATEVFVLSTFLFLLLGAFGFKEVLPMVLSSLGIAAGLFPLRAGLRRFIDRVIFRGKYDYQYALTNITNVVPTIIDQDKLIRYIVDGITKSMHIEKGVVLLKDERKDMYHIQYSVGLNGMSSNKTIDGKGELVMWLKGHSDVLLRYELFHLLAPDAVERLWSEITPFDSELVVPLHKGENLIGLLCLSHKGGGDVFNQDDFRILQTIANQAGVVIENIRLYNKLIHADRQTFLETLASGVSHEMRNRLVAIRTFIDLFPERVDLGHVEKDYIDFRELAVREMARLTKIIDGLLSYSRAVTIGGEIMNVNDLLEEAFLIIQPKLKDRDVNLETNLDPNVTTLTGDKGRLLQVFINIMQNGIEAMNKEGKLEVKSNDKGDSIEIDIADNGKGIPKEHLDAIFEPFFTTKHDGTGLGLSIVQRIVRDHSGTIAVSSEVGKGTTFTITFSKKGGYKPTEIAPKEGMRYWDVKKEYEEPKEKK